MDATSKALLALVALGAGFLVIEGVLDARSDHETAARELLAARAQIAAARSQPAPVKPTLSAEQERAESDRRMLEEEAAELVQLAQAEREARIGKKPIPSLWDGSYAEIEAYVKSLAHDPDSIDFDGCSAPVITDAGWNIRCVYRGKNAFGALVRNDQWFMVRHSRVVAVK